MALPPDSSTHTGSTEAPAKPLVLYGAGSVPALMASRVISAPFLAGTPNGAAAAPVRKVTIPMLTGFSWDMPAPANARPKATLAATTQVFFTAPPPEFV